MSIEQTVDELIKQVSDPKFWENSYWNKHSYGALVKNWSDKIRSNNGK